MSYPEGLSLYFFSSPAGKSQESAFKMIRDRYPHWLDSASLHSCKTVVTEGSQPVSRTGGRRVDVDVCGDCTLQPSIPSSGQVTDNFNSFGVMPHQIIRTLSVRTSHLAPSCPPQLQSILALSDPQSRSLGLSVCLCLPRSVFIAAVNGYMQKRDRNFRQSANYRSWHRCPQELSRTRTCRINKGLVVGSAYEVGK